MTRHSLFLEVTFSKHIKCQKSIVIYQIPFASANVNIGISRIKQIKPESHGTRYGNQIKTCKAVSGIWKHPFYWEFAHIYMLEKCQKINNT